MPILLEEIENDTPLAVIDRSCRTYFGSDSAENIEVIAKSYGVVNPHAVQVGGPDARIMGKRVTEQLNATFTQFDQSTKYKKVSRFHGVIEELNNVLGWGNFSQRGSSVYSPQGHLWECDGQSVTWQLKGRQEKHYLEEKAAPACVLHDNDIVILGHLNLIGQKDHLSYIKAAHSMQECFAMRIREINVDNPLCDAYQVKIHSEGLAFQPSFLKMILQDPTA